MKKLSLFFLERCRTCRKKSWSLHISLKRGRKEVHTPKFGQGVAGAKGLLGGIWYGLAGLLLDCRNFSQKNDAVQKLRPKIRHQITLIRFGEERERACKSCSSDVWLFQQWGGIICSPRRSWSQPPSGISARFHCGCLSMPRIMSQERKKI